MYPTYIPAIPDQFRIDQSSKEFDEKWIDGKRNYAAIFSHYSNDHGADVDRPEAGYPLESYMADNDLAVGRIVEYLSIYAYWKNMLIVITEDDAQNGMIYIDAHRSILMLISWVKKKLCRSSNIIVWSIFKSF
jgi:hypothetical protein